jgi:hypothetical protein
MPERATESIKPPAAAAIMEKLSFTLSYRNTTNKMVDDQTPILCPLLTICEHYFLAVNGD